LFLFFFSHFGEGIVLALELAFKSVKSSNNFLFDGEALLAVDGCAKGEFSEVASDTDASRVNHGVFIRWEVRAVELRVVHGADVLVIGAMAVVGFDNSIHKRCEIVVALM
jgi:hypothetical protein